ncbi:MAG: T9SS type A sorting domain-containing protein [Bacteroidota bacterium]
MKIVTLVLTSVFLSGLLAQSSFQVTRTYPEVQRADASVMAMPWAGGLNAPQFSSADLDGDGTQDDLYIFDRGGNKHLAFVRQADGQYLAAPELIEHFPRQIQHWVLLRDFDDDGVMDLFAHSDTLVSGMLVYKGIRRADGRIGFERLSWGDPLPILYFPLPNGFRTQILISTIDYPAIDDVDCDGDLDILTFSSGGGYVEWYQNMSIERGYGRDSLIFEKADDCYGGIFEDGISPAITIAGSPDVCPLRDDAGGNQAANPRHAGSTLLTFDNNQDGLKELALGDVSFTEIILLNNAGDCQDAWFNSQELDYPSNDVPVDIIFFPASFYLDINQDGIRDFVAAPNQLFNSEDYNVCWYYENEGQDDLPQPAFQDSQFLVRDMIDLGSGAIPTPFDANGDGRMDLVVSNYDRFGGFLGTPQSGLNLYLNISQTDEPVFRLTDTDYLGMREFNTTSFEFAPTFGDLTGDGLEDVVIGAQNGQLFFLENITTDGGVITFSQPLFGFQGIDVGQAARPRIIDLDRDGLNDLVIGGRDGRIRFFRNIGTPTTPAFNPDATAGDNYIQLGGIDTRNIGSSLGQATPYIVDQGDDFLVFTGTNRGQIEVYSGVNDNLDGQFTLEEEFFGNLFPGLRSEICFSDFSGNGKLELVVGNNRGGLSFFETDVEAITDPSSTRNYRTSIDFSVYPNPAKHSIHLLGLPEVPATLKFYNLNGQLIQTKTYSGQGNLQLNVNGLPAGVYVLRYEGGDYVGSERVVVY